ncbi:MAG: copper resistance protein NlpE N-terminal domain-containing protein [Pseudomonadota bacterium]|nr:copper resistance protein NlpE N-terminal domain-containing protein [Pseudomonadota bacterium]
MRVMSVRRILISAVLALTVLGAAGCDGGRDAAGNRSPAAAQLEEDGRIEWQAVLACADCDGIQTALVLNRSGDQRDYTLTETFLADDGGDRFVEQGLWLREDELVRLQSAGNGLRVFALLPDGRLEPRDHRGRRFAPRPGDALMPVSATTGL